MPKLLGATIENLVAWALGTWDLCTPSLMYEKGSHTFCGSLESANLRQIWRLDAFSIMGHNYGLTLKLLLICVTVW